MPRRAQTGVLAWFAASLALLGGATGCGRTVDEGECKELVAKMVDLLVESGSAEHASEVKSAVKGDPRAKSLSSATCVGKVTRSEYECMMAAKSVEAFAACDER